MLTLTRTGLKLQLNSSVVPAKGSGLVPVSFIQNDDEYKGFLVELHVGYTDEEGYKTAQGEYDPDSKELTIPSQLFKAKGKVDLTVALVDPEDPKHIEVCIPIKFNVVDAPYGTVVLPEEKTWQDYVLEYMTSNLNMYKGDKGGPGKNATITIGQVTTLDPDQTATVTNSGTETDAVLNFGLVKGNKGDKGDAGDNATIEVGTVTTLEPGQNATVQNTGSGTNAVLSFGIPKGDKGDKGDTGDVGPQGIQGPKGVKGDKGDTGETGLQGPQGETGPQGEKGDTGEQGPKGDKGDAGDNATIAIGTVTTLEPDQEATVQNTGTETNAVLSFGIPKGETGATGPQGTPGVNENVLHSDISKSENPNVDDAYEAPLQDLRMYGKSTQNSTTGKNLFNKETITDNSYIADDTGLMMDDNEQSRVASDYINVDGLSNIYIIDTDKSRWGAFYNSDKEFISGFISTGSINVPENAKYLRFTVPKTNVDTFMINAGTQALPYEPYTGGKPSPSPDYPQEITKIEEVDCMITGANLFDISKAEDGLITDGQDIPNPNYKRSGYISVVPGMKISRTSRDITGAAGNFFYDIDKNFLVNSSGINNAIDVPENAYYYRFVFANSLTELMVNKGETLLPYEPYQSQHVQFTPPAPLYSILDGSVADYVDVTRGKYVYQLTDVTFDGSADEDWQKWTDTSAERTNTMGFLILLHDTPNDTNFRVISDKFKEITNRTQSGGQHPFYGDTYEVIGGFYNNAISNQRIGVGIFQNRLSTVDAAGFKTWLQSNNIFVVYQLATPTEQDIPAETLEALQALKTFNGVTNVFCNAPVSAQYEQSVQIVINKILEQLNNLQSQTLSLQEEMINNV